MSAPLCSVWQRCGGCPWIALPVEEQRARKQERVARLFFDLLGSGDCSFSPVRSVDAYRNRIRLRVTEDGQPVFFNHDKSPECGVLDRRLRDRLDRLRVACRLAPRLLAGVEHLELRMPDLDGVSGLWMKFAEGYPDVGTIVERTQSLREQLDFEVFVSGARVGREGAAEAERWLTQRFPLSEGFYQRVPLDGFMQVNEAVNQALIEAVVQGARAAGVRSAVDLYCGSGNFSLPLSAAGLCVIGVERNPASVGAARRAAREQGLGVRFLQGSVDDVLGSGELQLAAKLPSASSLPSTSEQQDVGQQRDGVDLAIVDPPRAGLKQALQPLVRLGPRAIALCSCNPASLERDVRALGKSGYVLRSLRLFDMFVHTEHVELLAWLDRG